MIKVKKCEIFSVGVEADTQGRPLIILSDDDGHSISIPVEMMQDQIVEYRANQAAHQVRQAAKASVNLDL